MALAIFTRKCVKRRESPRSGVALRRRLSAVYLSTSLYDPAFHRHGPDCHGNSKVEPSKEPEECACASIPPQRRYLCLRPRRDSCRRSRFLKKHSHGHWLAEGGQNSDHDLSRYEPWYLPPRLVRSWLCSHGREPYMNRSDVCPRVDSKSD